jgi:dynein heavy chain
LDNPSSDLPWDHTKKITLDIFRLIFFANNWPKEIEFKKKCLFQAKRFLDPSSIFHSDIDEAMQRISQTIKILKYFRTIFDEYKENLAPFFNDRPVVTWTFHPNAVFERYNAFLDRLHTIQWFFYTVIEFLKLEKVEIGGLKGRILSGRITAVSIEFNQCFAAFASKTYDVVGII